MPGCRILGKDPIVCIALIMIGLLALAFAGPSLGQAQAPARPTPAPPVLSPGEPFSPAPAAASAAPIPAYPAPLPASPSATPASGTAAPAFPFGPTAPAAPGNLSLTLSGAPDMLGPTKITTGLQLLALLTVLSLAPAILMMMTGFVRIVVVLGFVRRAIGTTEVPPNQVVLGLALILTFFVMAPTLEKVNRNALQPYIAGQLAPQVAYNAAMEPVRDFLFAHCRKADLSLFVHLSGIERPRTKADVPSHVLIPAFMISELKTAFIIGFVIYVPFLIIDMVVSSILLSMGMMMLPPVVISLPFKVLLFVLVDGWGLVVESLMRSF